MTINATKPPVVDAKYFDGSNYENATLYVPDESVSLYANVTPWYAWGSIRPLSEKKPDMPGGTPCEMPTTSYENGKLTIKSLTQKAECYYTITVEYCKNDVAIIGSINSEATYDITAYAVADGYAKSNILSMPVFIGLMET